MAWPSNIWIVICTTCNYRTTPGPAVDFQLMGSSLRGTYLWPIVAISNICQGSAAFGAWFVYKRRKMVKEEGLALTSCISGMLGVTEPAMFGVNYL